MHLLLNDYNKVIYKTVDYSKEMKTWNGDNMTVTDGAIYIGAPHTFASRFMFFNTVNAISSAMSVKYYTGDSTWESVLNLADETRIGAVTGAQHGFISWDLPEDWEKCQIEGLPQISGVTGDGYGYYYIKIEFSITINAVVEWLGMLWTNENYMATRWPEVVSGRFLPTGKTNWYELIEMTTSDVGRELEYDNIIAYELQAKDVGQIADLTALKCLINILTPLISNVQYREMREEFQQLYNTAKKARIRKIDANMDEKIEKKEIVTPNSFRMVRR